MVILDYEDKRALKGDLGKKPRYSESNPDCPEFRYRGRVLALGRDRTWKVTILMRYGRMVEVI